MSLQSRTPKVKSRPFRTGAHDGQVIPLGRTSLLPAPSTNRQSDTAIEEIVEQLHAMQRPRSLALMIEIGTVVAAKLKTTALDSSLRKLAAHPKLPFSPATLWRAMGIFRLVTCHPDLVHVKHLGVGHFRAVVKLPLDVQHELLCTAEASKWSIEQLTGQAGQRHARKSHGGRPAIPEPLKLTSQMEKLIDSCRLPQQTEVGQLGSHQRQALRSTVESLREWCEEMSRRL